MATIKLKDGTICKLGRNYGEMRLLTKKGWKKTQLTKCPGCGSKKGGKRGSLAYWVEDLVWIKCAKCGKFIVHRFDYTGWKLFGELPSSLRNEGRGVGTLAAEKRKK